MPEWLTPSAHTDYTEPHPTFAPDTAFPTYSKREGWGEKEGKQETSCAGPGGKQTTKFSSANQKGWKKQMQKRREKEKHMTKKRKATKKSIQYTSENLCRLHAGPLDN